MMNVLKSIFSFCLIALATTLSHAQPPEPGPPGQPVYGPPPTPSTLFRADRRQPEEIFASGFQPWGAQRQYQDRDLLRHLSGDSLVNNAPADTGDAFVSTTESMEAAQRFARGMGELISSGHMAPQQYLWIYELAPQSGIPHYSVEWAEMDYLARHPAPPGQYLRTGRAHVVFHAWLNFGSQQEWVFEGTIQGNNVRRALRLSLNPDYNEYRLDGTVVDNPNFNPSGMPPAATTNPLDSFEEAPSGLNSLMSANSTLESVPMFRPIMPDPVSLGFTCLGNASPQALKGGENTASCVNTPNVFKFFEESNMPYSYVSEIKVSSDRLKSTYCLTPERVDSAVAVRVNDCDSSRPVVWQYNSFKQFALGMESQFLCMSVPQSVINGSSTWDWVSLEPCASHNTAQKWRVIGGVIYSDDMKYKVQEYEWHLIVSTKQDGYDFKLQDKQMVAEFFTNYSYPMSQQVELVLFWWYNGQKFYSTYENTTKWSADYWNRSYYDPKSKTIRYIDPYDVSSVSSSNPLFYCLTSNIEATSDDWNWTSWTACNDLTDPSPAMQWELVNSKVAYGSNSTAVQFQGVDAKDLLWVQTNGDINAGRYFSARKGTYANSTANFGVPDREIIEAIIVSDQHGTPSNTSAIK